MVATPLGEFVGSKADLFAEKTFSLVLSVRFLRRCLFQVVSLTSRFETTPDLNESKHIKFVVCKVWFGLKLSLGASRLTNCSRGIRNAWHFYYALNLVIKVVCGSIGIALLTP
ncbi:hypothetical protein, partial [Vibrio diabolicus]|uniref:hypothetical protein n=1 Tax=Vibrio diabolicus TaxID=50719 RepID=UPI002852F217